MSPIPPEILAVADQDRAASNEALDAFVDWFRQHTASRHAGDSTCAFHQVVGVARKRDQYQLAHMLAAAIARLAATGTTQPVIDEDGVRS
ncbi:Uncharacterised protein [Mycobacteroides abscessus subsp. bolletii]|uniref:hypothetical protein n=1 Tax=Mycobacteroides abscessus TaxID=36809 RepID=UPI00092BA927|nr:hypothetical protein [Mycobacteroides abscessus]SIJ51885.1 Uncharacterised protein [Mycobacteroides abscessus subsp. bolletii]SLD45709.1 Uncharacterised protein [Mycobacteroides abscessus subsp. bolletii]SLE35976.1 Uncharacterised protein [Mycobacteroides abscessus subsp. bolletii]